MPPQDIAILTIIAGVFVTFGVVLGWVSWYSRDGAQGARRTAAGHGKYPSHPGLLTDDD